MRVISSITPHAPHREKQCWRCRAIAVASSFVQRRHPSGLTVFYCHSCEAEKSDAMEARK